MLQLTIVGAIGADAKVQEYNGQKFVSFNVASSERYSDRDGHKVEKTTWVSCTINGDGGRLLEFLTKGTTVYCSGRASTRVYSSPKDRCMVAGLNLKVDMIELVGARPDGVPSRLADKSGLLHNVEKFYLVREAADTPFLPKENEVGLMFSEKGQAFQIDHYGWVSPIPDAQQTTTAETQSEPTVASSGEQAPIF